MRGALTAILCALVAPGCTDEPVAAGERSDVGELRGPAEALVAEPACFELDAPSSATVTWIWGDGAREAATPGARACHAFEKPGRVLVGVAVRVGDRDVIRTAPLVVVPRPLATAPTTASPVAYDAPRDLVFAASEDAGTVAVIDALGLERVAELPVGRRPRTVAVGRSHLAVACQEDDAVHLFALDDLRPVARVALGTGAAPYGVAARPGSDDFWVTVFGAGTVALLADDGAGYGVRASIEVGSEPRGIAAHPDGRLFVTRWRADTERGATLYVVDAREPRAPAFLSEIVLPPDVRGDTDTDHDGVPSFLNAAVLSPAGDALLLPALKANVVAGIQRNGRPLRPDTTARGILVRLDVPLTGAPREVPEGRHPFDDLDFASAVAFSPRGALVYVAFQGAERLRVLDAFSLDGAGSFDDAGHAPNGLALSPDGARVFVHASLSRAVFALDVPDAEAPTLARTIPTMAVEPLAPEVLRGKRVFHSSRDPRMSQTSYLSCASCHLDGEGDGLVWDFTQRGEGLRNTIPLAGRAGTAHGLLHWSANFDEVQDFEHDIRAGQGGAGFTSDQAFAGAHPLGAPKAGLSSELDALAAYLASLGSFGQSPLRRDDDVAHQASRARGEALFRSADIGCATCHAGPRTTDSGRNPRGAPILHDVGTLSPSSGARLGGELSGLDTPTLLGLWKSAPYLHDGSARTLREVLTTRNTGDRHGRTGHLAPGDLDDIETFLETLDDSAR